MSTESLKLQLIERLLRTEDESLLKQVAQLFRSSKDEVDEDGRLVLSGTLAEQPANER